MPKKDCSLLSESFGRREFLNGRKLVREHRQPPGGEVETEEVAFRSLENTSVQRSNKSIFPETLYNLMDEPAMPLGVLLINQNVINIDPKTISHQIVEYLQHDLLEMLRGISKTKRYDPILEFSEFVTNVERFSLSGRRHSWLNAPFKSIFDKMSMFDGNDARMSSIAGKIA